MTMCTKEQREEVARIVFPIMFSHPELPVFTKEVLHWVETGLETSPELDLTACNQLAQVLADRDAHIAQAHDRVMALASALQDVVAVASNLYAWDWSHHLDDSKGSDDVRKDMRALEQAAVAARPLLKQLREEIGESCVEEFRRSEKRSAVESIDWLKYAKYTRKR